MIPLRDDNPRYVFPVVTFFFIAVNVAVYIYQISLGEEARQFVYRLGLIPWEVVHLKEYAGLPAGYQSGFPSVLTLITSQFLHGGLLHLAGNMLFLYIFGDNIESLMGHLRFFIFYLLCGVAAALAYVLSAPNTLIPLVGASGAISGVLGAYFIKFPRARVDVLFILFIFIRILSVPAVLVLGIWFILQVLSHLAEKAGGGSGIAWMAHIGGWIAGMLLIFLFQRPERARWYKNVFRKGNNDAF